MPHDQPWQFPDMRIGDTIEIARFPEDFGKARTGVVTETFKQTVNASSIMTGGLKPYLALHHTDDPKLPDNPGWLKEPHSGVFRVSRATQQPRDNAAAIARLEELIIDLSKRVAVPEKPKKPTSDK